MVANMSKDILSVCVVFLEGRISAKELGYPRQRDMILNVVVEDDGNTTREP